MKKYLFLLFLFIIYVILITRKQTVPVFSDIKDGGGSVNEITLKFKSGINSNDLINEFCGYHNDYMIETIKTENAEYNVKCEKINDCIKAIFNQESVDFSNDYLVSGFKINEVKYISNDLNESSFLRDNSAIYVNK